MTKITVTLKNQSWFADNASYAGGIFFNKDFATNVSISTFDLHGDRKKSIFLNNIERYMWCIEETPETHPQYFI